MVEQVSPVNVTFPVDEEFIAEYSGDADNGVVVNVRQNLAIVQVFAKNGETGSVEKTLKIKSTPGVANVTGDYTAMPLSPGQWLLVSTKQDRSSFGKSITRKLRKTGYVSEQSNSRVAFRVSGSRVGELLQRGCRLDLHPDVAKKGYCAQTQMAQIGVLIHKVGEEPVFDLYTYSGFALDFAKWLAHTSAKYGVGFNSD